MGMKQNQIQDGHEDENKNRFQKKKIDMDGNT